jgi:uncharacterized membrane protein
MTTAINSPDITVKHSRFGVTRTLTRSTVSVAAISGVTTTAVAFLIRSAGVPLAVHGEIPLAGFAQFTIFGAVIGGVVVALLNRFSAFPRRRFLQLTIGFTALSCIVPAAFAATPSSKIALVALHVLAASIIVPVLVRHAN